MKKKNSKKNERQQVVDTIKKGLKPQKEPKSLPPCNPPYQYIPPICCHCWHNFYGVIWMVIPPGHTLKQCCKCGATKTVHVGHYDWDHEDYWPHRDIIWCGTTSKY
jgi:hypothetical protein